MPGERGGEAHDHQALDLDPVRRGCRRASPPSGWRRPHRPACRRSCARGRTSRPHRRATATQTMFWTGNQAMRDSPDFSQPAKLIGTGSWTQRPWPNQVTARGMSGIGWPRVTTSVRLRAIISVPSVTMKDGIFALVTTIPTSSPSSGPTNSGAIKPERDDPPALVGRTRDRHPADHDPAADRRRQADHGADRHVELAGDHHDRHAGRDDQHDRHLAEQVGDVRRRQEPVVGDLHDHDQDQENAERLDEAVGALEPRGEARVAGLPARPRSRKRSHADRLNLTCRRSLQDCAPFDRLAGKLADNRAAEHDQHAVAQATRARRVRSSPAATPTPAAATSSMILRISSLAPTSTPMVGSSMTKTFGLVSSHFANRTFCWLPPES